MKLKLPLLLASSVVAFSLVLSGCAPQDENTNPSTDTTPAPVSTGVGYSDAPDEPVEINASDNASELAQAQLLFPTAAATDNFSKEDVQLALFSAYSYFSASLDTPYYLNGSFETAGFPEDKIRDFMTPYFNANTISDFMTHISDRNKLADATGKPEFIQWLLSVVYFPELAGATPADSFPAACVNQQTQFVEGAPAPAEDANQVPDGQYSIVDPCILEPPTFTNLNYFEATDADGKTVLRVETTGSIKEALLNNGQSGYRTVTYKYVVTMAKNEYADWANGVHSWVINQFANPEATWTAWQAQ